MTFRVSHDPYMMDFLFVAARLSQDQQDQISAFSGLPFEIDGAAVGAYVTPGPKWVAYVDNLPIAVGGYVQQRPGVWRDYMLHTADAFSPENYGLITRHCRKIMNAMFKSGQAHRLECIVPLQRIESRPEIVRWYGSMKLRQEAVMQGYLANGYPAVLFSRVGH